MCNVDKGNFNFFKIYSHPGSGNALLILLKIHILFLFSCTYQLHYKYYIYINIFVWLLQSEGILDLLLKSQHLDPLVFIDMMDFCILHGYKISRDFMTRKVHSVKALQNCEQIQSWLQKTFETVPSLSNICRNLIRQQLSIRKKSRLQKSIENLPLPFLLKDFLAFKDEECESLLKLTF